MDDNQKKRKAQLDEVMNSMDSLSIPSETPSPTPTPEGAALNPYYQEGGILPKYMPMAAAQDTQGLEEPLVDPISLATTAATGGMSQIGPALMNAAKNKTTNEFANRIKAAAQKSNVVQGPATQVGNNTGYKQGGPFGSSQADYLKSIIEQLRQRGKVGQ